MRRLALVGFMLAGACTLTTDFDQFTGGPRDAGAGASEAGPGETSEGGSIDAGVDAAPVCAAGQDFSADPKNCGACGHDCLGGGCFQSKCQAVQFASDVKSFHIRLDATHAYLADQEAKRVVRVAKHGGPVEELAAKEESLYEFELSDQFVFYGSAQGLKRVAKTGGMPETVFAGGNFGYILTSGSTLFWSEGGADPFSMRLWRGDLDGKNAVVLQENLQLTETIAIDGDDLYFGENGKSTGGNGGNVWHRNLKTGEHASLVNSGARRLVIDATNVYWLDFTTPNVSMIPRAGGAKSTLASVTITQAADIAIDDRYVYWAAENDPGGVYRVLKTGGAPEQIASDPRPTGVAVDDAAVYWTLPEQGKVYFRAK